MNSLLVEKLRREHDTSNFHSGEDVLVRVVESFACAGMVDIDWQGKRIGAGLLKDSLLRTVQAADIVGIRAMIVHAKNDRARVFYEHFGFQPSPTDSYHLFRLLKDIRVMVGH